MSDIDYRFTENYPRDLIGYAGRPPHANWPGNARIAVQFVLNYEEGAAQQFPDPSITSNRFLDPKVKENFKVME